MKFAELKKSLKLDIKHSYILKGDDDFLLDRAFELIKNACNIELPELNLHIFKEDVDFEKVSKALETLPVMVDKKLVYVKITGKDYKNESEIQNYFKNPNPSSVFIVNVGVSNALKSYEKNFELVDCNRLSKDLIFPFVVTELKKFNKVIERDACDTLCDYTNNDLSKINNELKKLVGYVGEKQVINVKDVKELVSKSVEFQIFELTEALGKKDEKKVYEILSVVKTRKDELRGIIALIYKHFRRVFMSSISIGTSAEIAKQLGVQEYAVKKALEPAKLFTKKQLKEINDVCVNIDFDIKQSNMTVDNALDYLILKILNC